MIMHVGALFYAVDAVRFVRTPIPADSMSRPFQDRDYILFAPVRTWGTDLDQQARMLSAARYILEMQAVGCISIRQDTRIGQLTYGR